MQFVEQVSCGPPARLGCTVETHCHRGTRPTFLPTRVWCSGLQGGQVVFAGGAMKAVVNLLAASFHKGEERTPLATRPAGLNPDPSAQP